MKIYKKFMVLAMLRREGVIYIGHPTEKKIRYDNKEVLRLSKNSIVHNLMGLEKDLIGHIVKLKRVRKGIEESKLEIDEVRIENRLIPYHKYCESVDAIGLKYDGTMIIKILY